MCHKEKSLGRVLRTNDTVIWAKHWLENKSSKSNAESLKKLQFGAIKLSYEPVEIFNIL